MRPRRCALRKRVSGYGIRPCILGMFILITSHRGTLLYNNPIVYNTRFCAEMQRKFCREASSFCIMRSYYTKRIVFAMYKAARDVHTNGIHNTFTSKGRGKMNHIKQFFREKGLYLFCLAMVFAATAAGILALRTVVSNVADLTRTRKEALQNDSAWTQPDTAIDKPAQDVPKPTTTPAATEKPSATPAPAAAQAPKATAAPPAQTVTKPGIWDAKPLATFSGNELVYSATLGDWRTHNGADYAAPAGKSVTAAKAGKVVSVSEDALWGVVVEVEDANGVTWRYCGVAAPAVKAGDSVTAAAALGTAGSIPAETSGDAHIHLECVKDGAYLDPEGLM